MATSHTLHHRDELELIASAAAVPMLIVDYTPIIEHFAGLAPPEVALRLADDGELIRCLRLPRVLAVSPQWIDLYGSPLAPEPPDLDARQFTPATHPDLATSMRLQFLAPFTGETSIVREHSAPTMLGDVVVRSHWKAALDGGRPDYTRVVIVDHNVTDLRAALRSLEDALESRDRLVATVGHELRHPVSAMVGFGAILLDGWDDLSDEERKELVGTLVTQADDITVLMDDLLTAATSRSMAVASEQLDMATVLESVDLREVDVMVEVGLAVLGDALRIRQIVRNLVGNARKHGGGRVELAATTAAHGVTVTVTDDGAGIPADVAVRLFELFAHGGASGSLGIGLAVSRMLARAMGGDLSLVSARGPTIFELTLPGVDSPVPASGLPG
jgi:signal transduction histidine kinase